MPKRRLRSTPAYLVGMLIAAVTMPSTAVTFISTDMTIANGSPISGNYTGSEVRIGVNASLQPVLNVRVDVVPSAVLNCSDQTGGGLSARINSVV